MIKLKKNLKKFVNILKILELLNEDITLNFEKDKILIRMSDRSSISLLLLEIDKSFFDEYKVKDGIYSINISSFIKIIRKVGKKEVEINLESDHVSVKNNTDEFKMNYYVVPPDIRDVPNPPFTNVWEIDSKEFFSSIFDLSEFSNVGCINSGDDLYISIKSKGVEGKSLVNSKKIKGKECKCFYDLTFINCLSDIKEIFDTIQFKFGEDCPCSIQGNNEEINLTWFLAERVDDSE